MMTGSPEGFWSHSNDQSEEPLQTHANQKAVITHVIILFYAVLALKVRPERKSKAYWVLPFHTELRYTAWWKQSFSVLF